MIFHAEIEHFAKMAVPEEEWGDYVVLYLGSAEVYRWKITKLDELSLYSYRQLTDRMNSYNIREADQDGLDAFVAAKLGDLFSSLYRGELE